MSTPQISVVVPAYNAAGIIGACIDSILRDDSSPGDREVIVVDNGSADATRAVISRYPVRYLCQPKPGAAAARNMGIRHARGEYVAFTDADCVVERRWLAELVQGFENASIACVGGEIAVPPPENDLEHYCVEFNSISQENAVERKVNLFPHVITANAMFRRGIFDKVGYFDERLTSAGGEDLDLGWRIHWAGYRMRYVPSARVVHRHKSSIRQLFRQHYRYGYGWTVIVRKHRELFKNAGPSFWGICPGDIRAFRAAVLDCARSMCAEGLTRETKCRFYHVVRQLGEYSGKFAAAVSR